MNSNFTTFFSSTTAATTSTSGVFTSTSEPAATAVSEFSVFRIYTYEPTVPAWEFCIRLIAVFFMMLALGLERQAQRKPLGFGVFTLIGCGSASAAMLAIIVKKKNRFVN